MTRDYGFAPNPFGGYCTLATCKPHIRKKAEIGDWIIGTGSKEINLVNRLIYLMQVSEKLPLEVYWEDPRFQFKKPILNGSLVTIHGDNVYSKDERGEWKQTICQHSHADFTTNIEHLKNDTSGEFVLVSDCFYYFGHNHLEVPEPFLGVCCELRDYCSPKKLNPILCGAFLNWVSVNFTIGIHGKPIDWRLYNQLSLF
jgi:hypothetical protein